MRLVGFFKFAAFALGCVWNEPRGNRTQPDGRIWHWLIHLQVFIPGGLPDAISNQRSLAPSGKDTRSPWYFWISTTSRKSTIGLAIPHATTRSGEILRRAVGIWTLEGFENDVRGG